MIASPEQEKVYNSFIEQDFFVTAQLNDLLHVLFVGIKKVTEILLQ